MAEKAAALERRTCRNTSEFCAGPSGFTPPSLSGRVRVTEEKSGQGTRRKFAFGVQECRMTP